MDFVKQDWPVGATIAGGVVALCVILYLVIVYLTEDENKP